MVYLLSSATSLCKQSISMSTEILSYVSVTRDIVLTRSKVDHILRQKIYATYTRLLSSARFRITPGHMTYFFYKVFLFVSFVNRT